MTFLTLKFWNALLVHDFIVSTFYSSVFVFYKNQSIFVYSLSIADQYIKTGMAKTILVVGAETQTKLIDIVCFICLLWSF